MSDDAPPSVEKATDDEGRAKVRFFYIKSNQFRVAHMDGAIGSVTPRGFIHCACYSERPAIPTEHEFLATASALGPPVDTKQKDGWVREIEIDLMMDFRTATELRKWLDRRLKEYAEVFGSPDRIDNSKNPDQIQD